MLGFSLLYLPQLLLALITTLDFKYSSLTILWKHPSLILLPFFTFFTFSKPRNFCRKDPSDNRVMFSVKYTKINMAISIASYTLFCYVMRFILQDKSDIFENYYSFSFWGIFFLFALSIILTITFLYFDYLFCCCCQCFLSSKNQTVVCNPNQPDKTFHLVNGEIIEISEKAEGLRSKFIEMNTRDAVIFFANNLDLTVAVPTVVTAHVSPKQGLNRDGEPKEEEASRRGGTAAARASSLSLSDPELQRPERRGKEMKKPWQKFTRNQSHGAATI